MSNMSGTKTVGAIVIVVIISFAIFLLPLLDIRYGGSGPQDFGVVSLFEEYEYTFSSPVDIQRPPDGSPQLFVVEQAGRIMVFPDATDYSSIPVVSLDITDRVTSGGEMGLLGMALHPEFSRSGYIFVDYTADNPRRTVISRFNVTEYIADPTSEKIILEVDQPYSNHNAGQLAFGPDGYLYVTLGDGGLANDPSNNGQNPQTFLGSILRLDINVDAPYAIPADNPFVGNSDGWKEEIWAYGFRNPWRISFDNETGMLWAGDVGQNLWEEVDVVTKGGNFGWNAKEGTHCFALDPCEGDFIEPIHEYNHSEGISITGGYIYHGDRLPALEGYYVFGDYASGNIWALKYEGTTVTDFGLIINQDNFLLSTFGIGYDGELLLADYSSGHIYSFIELTRT